MDDAQPFIKVSLSVGGTVFEHVNANDATRMVAMKKKHFPKSESWAPFVASVVLCLCLFATGFVGIIMRIEPLLVVFALAPFPILVLHLVLLNERETNQAQFRADLAELNLSLRRNTNLMVQLHTESGETFELEKPGPRCQFFPIQFVGGGTRFSDQFSITLARFCGEKYVEDTFPTEVEQLNRVLRARKCSSPWFVALRLSLLYGLTLLGALIGRFVSDEFSDRLLFALGGLLLGLGCSILIAALMRKALNETRQQLVNVIADLSQLHSDETWNWEIANARPTCLSRFLCVSEVLGAGEASSAFALPIICIRKQRLQSFDDEEENDLN